MTLIRGSCVGAFATLPPYSLVVTDPPYGVLPRGKQGDRFTWDSFPSQEAFVSFTRDWFLQCKKHLVNDSFMFVFWSQKLLKLGLDLFSPSRVLMWHYKNLTLGGNGDFAYDYEPIFVVKKGNPKLVAGKHSSILEFTKPQSNFTGDRLVHPTQKPLKLVRHLIGLTEAAEVLDPFMGSGTTGAAARSLGRGFVGIERDEGYFGIAEERLNSPEIW
jgi:modification methylase